MNVATLSHYLSDITHLQNTVMSHKELDATMD